MSLLMLYTGSTGLVVHLHGLKGLAKGHLRKQTWPSLAIYLVYLDSAGYNINVKL